MSYANRGKPLESLLIQTNETYKMKGWAIIDKVPTPWQVVRRGKQIISAFPQQKAIVDFVGISHGRFLAFDAKSTNERTRFPLSNIEPHQMDYMKAVQEQGGLSFFIIEFAKLREVYFVPYALVAGYWYEMERGGKKSISYADIRFKCEPVQSCEGAALHYLKYCN